MSKFNVQSESTKVENLAGGQAFQESPKLAFVSLLLTSLLKDQYYRSEEDTMKELVDFIDNIDDKKFVAKASIYARNEFGMRSVTHVVGAELAHKVKGQTWMRPFLFKNFHRVDDMTETWSYYMAKYGNPVPNSLHFAVKKAFAKFDSYQLAKYRAQDKEYKLVDLINHTHPVATDKNKEAMEGLIKDSLKASNTWNAELAKAGREADAESLDTAKKEVWTKLIKEGKLPYFAAVRNIRNVVEQAPDLIDDLCAIIENEAMLRKSLMFPFRFVTAVKQLQQDGINEPRVYKSLNVALELSMNNVPKLPGKTLVAIDHSGSMDSHGASRALTNFEIGALFGITLAKSNNADIIYFGDIAKYAAINPLDSTPTLINYLSSLNKGAGYWGSPTYGTTDVGHGTNFTAVFQEAKQTYDRICFFSDMQGWMNGGAPTHDFYEYKKRTGANPKIYSFDLAGHGTLMFPENDIFCLAGFSDKIFGLMKLMESDKQAMLTAIENVEL